MSKIRNNYYKKKINKSQLPRERQILYLTPKDKEAIRVLAKSKGVSGSKYLNDIVNKHLKDLYFGGRN